jgi:hypothetical protein
MWIFTTEGFTSVVAYDARRGGPRSEAEETLVVRSRVRSDLKDVVSRCQAEVLATPRSDYPFRAFVQRDDMASYVADSVKGIDYPDFKSEVDRKLGHERHDVLLSVWSTLHQLEQP